MASDVLIIPFSAASEAAEALGIALALLQDSDGKAAPVSPMNRGDLLVGVMRGIQSVVDQHRPRTRVVFGAPVRPARPPLYLDADGKPVYA